MSSKDVSMCKDVQDIQYVYMYIVSSYSLILIIYSQMINLTNHILKSTEKCLKGHMQKTLFVSH